MKTINIHASELGEGVAPFVQGVLRALSFVVLLFLLPPAYYSIKRFKPELWSKCICLYYTILTKALDIDVRVFGNVSDVQPTLFVANHTSYLDVVALGTVVPGSFIAKSEVAAWPIIGWLAKMQNTAFVERRSVRALEQRETLRGRLEAHESLILFPEGTSTSGEITLPFKSSLFAIAEKPLDDGTPIVVQPVSVVCMRLSGLPIGRACRPYYSWFGDTTLVPHLWNVFKFGRFGVDLVFHPAITNVSFANRKEMAEYCEKQVRLGMEACLSGKPERFLSTEAPV